MKNRRDKFARNILAAVGLVLISMTARAGITSFMVDTNESSLTISGSFEGIDFDQQGAGSLTTHYMGTIKANVTGSTIAFPGGSTIIGMTNGSWQPLPGGASGNAPANYGGQVFIIFIVNGKAAVRNVRLDLTSTALAVTGGTFPSAGLQFTFPPTGTTAIDYNYSGLIGSGSGGQPLTGTTTNAASTNATLLIQGTNLVLTLPVDVSGIAPGTNNISYQLIGQIVAKAPAPVPLQVNSFQVSPGQLHFTISTTPGQPFSILGSTNLTDWPTIVDQFTATNNPSLRTIALPASLPQQYFRVRQD